MSKILVPVGNSDFTEIRQEKYYFIDKSGLIEELIKTKSTKVTLITRPRRFGKTLAMSMLASFFDLRRTSRELFDGLSVSKNKEVCDNWMNQYPTLFLSFRSVDGLNFPKAYAMLAAVIADLYKEHFYLTENLTYNLLESSEENLWSLLYLTGYLTRLKPKESSKLPDDSLLPGQYTLTIPNTEVMDIFKKSVRIWLTESLTQRSRRELFTALWDNNGEKLTEIISDLLFTTISYHDYKENFYHAFITGLLSNAGFLVESNNESGLGRADIIVKDRPNRQAAIIEIKWTNTKNSLETQCHKALQQIEQMQYAKSMENEGFRKVLRFGMAFYRKECLVKTG